MKKILQMTMIVVLTMTISSIEVLGQCASNMGFDNGNFGSWNTSTDSNYITPANRRYYNPGLTQAVVSYGSTDALLGTINKPSSLCGNNLTRIGNKGLLATADTVYRTYIVDSLSDMLTIYSKGVVEIAHNYWGLTTIEAPGFGYEVYLNGKKLDCLNGSFFCGNQDLPYFWNVGKFKDTAGVRKTIGWAKEEVNLACYVGDTIELRLFTRDCILLGHYAYAYFDVICGDTTKPVITRIMVNDIIDADKLNLYCTDSTTLSLAPNTSACPIFRTNIKWTPSTYVFGSDSTDNVILHNLDSVWIFAEATFSNYCTTINVRDSILILLHTFDPHDNIPGKVPVNFCDCLEDTLDFGTGTVTIVKDEYGNTMKLNNGKLIIMPCDKFYTESFWKNESSKIHLNKSQIGTIGWATGNVEGAIGYDSILATGTVRYIIDYKSTKKFFAGITTNNVNNSNDMDFAIYYNGGAIGAYYRGALKASLGSYTGSITIDFRTLLNRRVEIWINGIKVHTYTNAQKAIFPIFPDFAGQCDDTAIIYHTFIYGPTKNIKDFTRLLLPTTFKYYISYTDKCGIPVKDTIEITPGYTSVIKPKNITICGLKEVKMITNAGSFIIDEIIATSNGDGSIRISDSMVFYSADILDYASSPISVFITTRSGRCSNIDTGYATFKEVPVADAGPDISSTPNTYNIGGTPSGFCSTCSAISYSWNPAISLDDSTTANPLVTDSLVTNNYFALQVTDTITGCFSMDTAYIFEPLTLKTVSIESNCLLHNMIEFKWTLVPSFETYSFGIEYSNDNGSNWISMGKLVADLNLMNNEPKTYSLLTDKIMNQDVIYRWFSFSMNGDKKSVIPIYDIDCQTKTTYSIFPNPFSNELNLEIQTNNPSRSTLLVLLYNEYGQKVYEKKIGTEKGQSSNHFFLNGTESLMNGIYFMNITSNEKVLYKTKILKLD